MYLRDGVADAAGHEAHHTHAAVCSCLAKKIECRGRTRFLRFCLRKGIDSCTSLAPFFVDNDIFFCFNLHFICASDSWHVIQGTPTPFQTCAKCKRGDLRSINCSFPLKSVCRSDIRIFGYPDIRISATFFNPRIDPDKAAENPKSAPFEKFKRSTSLL